MDTIYFDIESNGLLDTTDRLICIGWQRKGQEPQIAFTPEQIQEALSAISLADEVVGHNVIAFDIPVLKKLYPQWSGPKGAVRDTLVLARLVHPDIKDDDFQKEGFPKELIGSHSLKAWGERLGMSKGVVMEEVVDWRSLEYTDEIGDYCKQDVRLTASLHTRLISKIGSLDSVLLEHNFAEIIADQIRNGFAFDKTAAGQLYSVLAGERDRLVRELQAEVPPTIVKLKTKTKEIPFNPASRQQIAAALRALGWEPTEFTPSGEAKVDEAVLGILEYPIAKKLSHYLLIQKRIGMLAEGDEAWLKVERGGRIYGSVNHNGAVTGRCTHRGPNMAQVPACGSPYGKECRSLFTTPEGMCLVGVDAAGLELRCLAHYMAKYDDGAFAKELLEGDIHTANQKAAGLPTRNDAKSFIYAFLYGAGPAKLGKIIGGGYNEGKEMQKRFLAKVPALKQLKDAVEQACSRGYLYGLDGRMLRIRSPHSALNTLLQSAGAIIMKQATVLMHKELIRSGLNGRYKQVAHIHDEVQFEVRKEDAEEASKIVKSCITKAGEVLGFRCRLDGESKIGRNWAETH
jgi:DNA polymerase-1